MENFIDISLSNSNGRTYCKEALSDIAIMIKDGSSIFAGELTHNAEVPLDVYIEHHQINDNISKIVEAEYNRSAQITLEFLKKHADIIPVIPEMEKNEAGEITNFNITEFNIIPKNMKIQSQSDIITNSSSEVFIVDTSYAEKISNKTGMPYDVIDIDYLKDHLDFVSIICKLANVTVPDFDPCDDSYIDNVISFIDDNSDILNEYLKNDISLLCNDYSCTDATTLQEIRENSKWNDFQ